MNKVQLKGKLEKQAEDLLKGISLSVSSTLIQDTLKHFYDLGLSQMETQFNMDFTREPSSLTNAYDIVAEEIKGLNNTTRGKLKLQLMVGISGQESASEMSARVRKVMDTSISSAKRIVVTENNRVFNQAHYDGAVQSGLRLKKYVSVQMDTRTSPICVYMNQKYGTPEKSINMDAEFIYPKTGVTFQLSPFHPNCRTRVLYAQVENIKEGVK